jgi:surface antigen
MTYEQFKNKWLGKGIDYDGYYANQCMDVYRMYVKEVLQAKQSPSVKGAKNVWDTYLPEVFDRISNTSTGVPKQGDVMIWDVGTYGHIGIVDSATQTKFTTFEQNWTEGNGSGVTELRTHYYKNVLGWLTPKGNITMTEQEKKLLEIIKQASLDEGDIRWLADNIDIKDDDVVGEQEEEIRGLQKTISELFKDLDKIDKKYNKLLEDYNILLPKYEDILEKWEKLADKKTTAKDLSIRELLILLINKIFKK